MAEHAMLGGQGRSQGMILVDLGMIFGGFWFRGSLPNKHPPAKPYAIIYTSSVVCRDSYNLWVRKKKKEMRLRTTSIIYIYMYIPSLKLTVDLKHLKMVKLEFGKLVQFFGGNYKYKA